MGIEKSPSFVKSFVGSQVPSFVDKKILQALR